MKSLLAFAVATLCSCGGLVDVVFSEPFCRGDDCMAQEAGAPDAKPTDATQAPEHRLPDAMRPICPHPGAVCSNLDDNPEWCFDEHTAFRCAGGSWNTFVCSTSELNHAPCGDAGDCYGPRCAPPM